MANKLSAIALVKDFINMHDIAMTQTFSNDKVHLRRILGLVQLVGLVQFVEL